MARHFIIAHENCFNNWIEEWRGSQLWWESIANQKLMPESCETLKHWAQNFKKSLRGTEYDNWFCGLWKIWYYIIDMTILLNISMSHIKMSTKILYHITYLNLRYNIRYLYQRYYIFNITDSLTIHILYVLQVWMLPGGFLS